MEVAAHEERVRIPKPNAAADYAVWTIYVRELLHRDSLAHVVDDPPPDPDSSTAAAVNRLRPSFTHSS